MLDIACKTHNISKTSDASGNITSIEYDDYLSRDIIANDSNHTWGLWTVDDNGNMAKSDSYSIKASDYKVTIWAYTENNGGVPTIAVDSTNTSIYGYSSASRVVTLSPVSTEIVCTVAGGPSCIVGTDSYSDYPESVSKARDSNNIATVGTYLSPSYESIMNTNPDLVICDGSVGNHIQMAQKIKNSSVNAIVLYNATDIKSIWDNMFIVSTAMNYSTASKIIVKMSAAMEQIDSKIADHSKSTLMVSLGAFASPYVAGGSTYANEIVTRTNGNNVFENYTGWPLITSEYIPEKNPSKIFVIDSGGYKTSEYDQMISQISTTTWKNTGAYNSGEIYLLTEDLGTMAQRAGPRFIQFYEICARLLNPDCFDDPEQTLINSTKAIGLDYSDYISYTKYIGV